eukprot:GHVU01184100.1.p1 GENE.GHVU01184100.1~~GHVU01184100.1.p1  ORF type:complete len:120 (+),score=21.07 GHVU01184100.1:356-715(+)
MALQLSSSPSRNRPPNDDSDPNAATETEPFCSSPPTAPTGTAAGGRQTTTFSDTPVERDLGRAAASHHPLTNDNWGEGEEEDEEDYSDEDEPRCGCTNVDPDMVMDRGNNPELETWARA